MNRLDNKIAVVTGGAHGQGAAEAELFIAAGAQVVITDVDIEGGEATAERLGASCQFMAHDVASEEAWVGVIWDVVDRYRRIDVLVNNAGIFRVLGLEETPLAVWDELVAINQTGVFLGMRTVAPVMKEQRSGAIVNISSIAGLVASAQAHAYSATKWAVRGMSKSAAVELGPSGIRVNSVHPGFIDTQMLDEFGSLRETLADKVPLGRMADATEVARLVLFLASDDAAYCSGHEFVVDGAVRS